MDKPGNCSSGQNDRPPHPREGGWGQRRARGDFVSSVTVLCPGGSKEGRDPAVRAVQWPSQSPGSSDLFLGHYILHLTVPFEGAQRGVVGLGSPETDTFPPEAGSQEHGPSQNSVPRWGSEELGVVDRPFLGVRLDLKRGREKSCFCALSGVEPPLGICLA